MIVRLLSTLLLTPVFLLGIGTFSSPLHADTVAVLNEVPTTPNLALPTDGATTTGVTHAPLGVPALSWTATAGAEKYRVEISASAGFADPIVEQITYQTTFTPISGLPDGEYFWRVRAGSGADWGEYSEVRTFTKDWDADDSILPTLVAPEDESVRTTFAHQDFKWTAMRGAAGYLLEVATDETFSAVVYSAETTTTTHTPVTHLNNNEYFWRVTPYDNQGNFSSPSPAFRFTFDWNIAPEPISPENDVDLAYSPTLSWTAVEGAKEYRLEVDTEDDFPSPQYCTCYTTNFTWYKNLSNDQEYFWRVKAIDNAGNSSPWSEVRRFRIKWEFEPALLTPNNNVIHQGPPHFSWAPIPGVERYQFQVDESTSFERPKTDIEIYNATHAGITVIKDTDTYVERDYFWRVRGIDAQDNYTPWTEIHSFRFGWETSPDLVYPQVYYAPDSENLPDARDETIGHPLFVWSGAHKWDPYPLYAKYADYYEVTVAADPAFSTIHFQAETTSLGAAPTADFPFANLTDGDLAYWRVRAFINPSSPTQIGADSAWVTRIDSAQSSLPITDTAAPIYPDAGFTAVDFPPVLGWLPVQDADQYQIQVSRDVDFTTVIEDVNPQFPNYVPGLGSRTKLEDGIYWWRIRALDADDAALTAWSDARHFYVATKILNGNPNDLTPPAFPDTILHDFQVEDDGELSQLYRADWTNVFSDTNDGLANGELTAVNVMLNRLDLRDDGYPFATDNYNWILSFAANLSTDSSVYALYVDSDHIVGSGATSDPYGVELGIDSDGTDGVHLPEHVLYVKPSGGTIGPANVELFSWNGTAWQPAQTLNSIGGDAWYSAANGAVQLLVPYTALGPGEENWSGSLALVLYSMDSTASGIILDAVPNQQSAFDNPMLVADMVMPLYPFDTPLSDPILFEDIPALRWQMPSFGSIDGYEVEVARDRQFTDLVETWDINESKTGQYFAMLSTTFQSEDAYEDNESYYWRVRLRHERYSTISTQFDYSSWSPPMRFRLTSRTVGNPRVSTGILADTTPYFSWDRVEGAAGYRIEIDDDVNFSDPEFEEDIDSTAYASVGAMWDGTWYWRVAIRRSNKVRGEWSPTMSFTKRSLAPTPISPVDGEVINNQPNFLWSRILTPTMQPRVSAPTYRLEIDDDPNFSDPEVYETDLTSFTLEPKKNLADGTWYWRVAMMDAADNVGAYSAVQDFYKEYLPPALVSPTQGTPQYTISGFEWEPVSGAAYYEFEYADNALFNQSKTVKTDNAHYTPPARMSAREYFWRVRIYDEDRNPGPFIIGKVELIKNDLYLPYLAQ